MPLFEIQSPDGKSYQVEAPDIDAAFEAIGMGAKPQAPQDGGGMLKQGGQGLVEGVTGLASFPAQIGEWLGEKATGAIDKYALGKSDEEIQQSRAAYENTRGAVNPISAANNVNSMSGVGAPVTTGEKFSRTVGNFLPGALIGGGGMVPKVASAVTGGLASEGAGQAAEKYWPDAEPYARLGGAIAGGMVPSLARKAITPNPISPQRAQVVADMKAEGIELTPGQITGSERLKYMESELGGRKAASMMANQGEQFTAAALKRAGITANRATPGVIDDAFNRIGKDFDDLAVRNNLPPDPQIATDVASVVQEFADMTPSAARAPVVQSLATDMLNAAQSGMSGKQYQAISSRIGKMARGTNDPQLKSALSGMKDALDDAMERALTNAGSPDAGMLSQVRNQYRNMIVLEQAAAGAGVNAADGIISPSHLRNATVSKHGKRNYVRGKGDFASLARGGEATMKPLPQSGTAPRTAARNIGTSLPAIVGALLGSSSGPLVGFLGGAAGAAAPYAIGRAMLSKPGRAYLTNQLMAGGKPMSATQRALINALSAGNGIRGPQN